MEAMFIGRRTGADADELVAITVWRDLDALIAIFGSSWSEPSFFPELRDAIIDSFSCSAAVTKSRTISLTEVRSTLA